VALAWAFYNYFQKEKFKMIEFREASLKDAIWLSSRLSTIDATSLAATSGKPVKEALIEAYEQSDFCMTAAFHGSPLMLFGVEHLAPGCAGIWMKGAAKARNYAKDILTGCQQIIGAVLAEDILAITCMVDRRNLVYPSWLKALGFEVIKEWEQYGAEQRPFIQYARGRHV
jgi:hypothetical protein